MSSDPGKLNAVYHSRLAIIRSLLGEYDGMVPFHIYLKSCFQKHKNFGSRDRKIYTAWCYAFFRLGKTLPDEEFQTRLSIAWYLVHGPEDDFFKFLNKEKISGTDSQSPVHRVGKITGTFPEFSFNTLFPFKAKLSGHLALEEYALSMLVQPKVWIRVVNGKEKSVEEELVEHGIGFIKDEIMNSSWSFDQGVKLDVLQAKQKGYFEIQDRSSQLAGAAIPARQGEHWWDCCCGAGGKSLELFDRVPGIKITATDSRSSILKNFRERTTLFQNKLSTTVLNLENPVGEHFFGNKFDGIVADVPCTGSGTWSRNPENLSFFNEALISDYVRRQQTIVASAVPFLKANGIMAYITCSVFTAENEEMVHWICANLGMTCLDRQFVDGTSKLADSMFYALLLKN